jgi:hypothetical protein
MMHTHRSIAAPEVGKTYTCILNDTALYDAVVEQAQGCWASVKVVRPVPGKNEHLYSPGQTFEIKVQYYHFVEKQ